MHNVISNNSSIIQTLSILVPASSTIDVELCNVLTFMSMIGQLQVSPHATDSWVWILGMSVYYTIFLYNVINFSIHVFCTMLSISSRYTLNKLDVLSNNLTAIIICLALSIYFTYFYCPDEWHGRTTSTAVRPSEENNVRTQWSWR